MPVPVSKRDVAGDRFLQSELAEVGLSQSRAPTLSESESFAIVRPAGEREDGLSRPKYVGEGTQDSPYIVDWDDHDPENPFNWRKTRKWPLTLLLASGTMCISFASSSYTGGISFLEQDLHVAREVAVLGISLYVLGFGLGPLLFAPLSEMYGRRLVFLFTFTPYTLFHMGGALGKNMQTILITRLLAGVLGSAPLTNAGGAIADFWIPRERGVAVGIYSTAPFLGPVIGPIVGGFVAENSRLGWRFDFWIMMMFAAAVLITSAIFMPETYAPVLLRRRALRLQKASDDKIHYTSKFDINQHRSLKHDLKTNLRRPFVFLATEPIVSLISIYVSFAYATLYATFAAFPIVFEEHHGFTASQGGLAFLGIGLGMVIGCALAPIQNKIYWRAMDSSPSGIAPPEARLYGAMLGAMLLPIALFWFAWTSQPSVSYFSPIFAGVPFGTAQSAILQSLSAYIMDSYHIYSASALAATVVLRSVSACAFPLFTPYMFDALGDQWATSVFALFALVCSPIPILFFKFGSRIRDKSRFALKEEQFKPGTSGVKMMSRISTLVEKKTVALKLV